MADICCDWVSIHSDWLMPLSDQLLNTLTIVPAWEYMYSPPTSFHPRFTKPDASLWGSQNRRWQEHSNLCEMYEQLSYKAGLIRLLQL